MNSPVPEKIVLAFLAGTATALEEKQLRDWLHADKNHVDLFYRYVSQWEREHPQYTPDTVAALADYNDFLNGKKSMQQVLHRPVFPVSTSRRSVPVRYWWIAACLVLLLATIGLKENLRYQTYSTRYGAMQTVELPDGSRVTLNANSTLRVPRDIADSEVREVWITGEGFFSVAKTAPGRRFVVHATHLDVEVLGTRFNVRDRRGKTAVLLDEGKVKLIPTAKPHLQPVLMQPNDYIVVGESDTALHKRRVYPEKYKAWQENKLVFEEASLSQVAQTIEDHYGVKISIISDSIARRRLTGTLPNNDLEVVLQSLAVSCKLRVVKEKNRIVFKE